jgi:hypothetical protein
VKKQLYLLSEIFDSNDATIGKTPKEQDHNKSFDSSAGEASPLYKTVDVSP